MPPKQGSYKKKDIKRFCSGKRVKESVGKGGAIKDYHDCCELNLQTI